MDAKFYQVVSADSPPGGPMPPEEWILSKGGQRFNLHADRWQLTSRHSLNTESIRRQCWSPILVSGTLRTLAEFARIAASGSVGAVLLGLQKLLAFAPENLRTDEISYALLVSFRDACRRHDGHDHLISARIRPFLRRWHRLGYPGVPKALIETIEGWALKNPEKGTAVNRLDTHAGPLMPDEHASLAAYWLTMFEQGKMDLSDYVMARLSSVTGRRSEQIRQLKLRDMDDTHLEDSELGRTSGRILLLHIPRIKSKGGEWRMRFRAVPLSSDLWNLLIMQRDSVHKRLDTFLEHCGLSLQPGDLKALRADMPLIPSWYTIDPYLKQLRAVAKSEHGEAIGQLRVLACSDAWHAGRLRVNNSLRNSDKKITNRDGSPMHVFPQRLRYTREFDLERAGCTATVIAWNMDHSSVESLVSYSLNGPDRARSLGNAMAVRLKPFVMMFQGRVVDDESEAEGGDDPSASRILFQDLKPGATCAAKRGCGMTAIPRPCYGGCPHFRPWVDGPHEKYLESLLEERERMFQMLRPVEDRAIIEASDSLIIGVVQVIQLCDQRRAQLSERSKSTSGLLTGQVAKI